MRRFTCGWLVPLFGALLPFGAAAQDCEPRHAKSAQAAGECRFQNPPNPMAKPHRSSWDIWSRMLLEKKHGTVPVDPVPVRRQDRAALDALDVSANHIIRLGHSSHLLKLRGKWWLIDPVFGPRASPVTWAGPKRFHEPPVALADVPQIEGLILSHDHYDHLDVPTIEALKDRVQRYFVPLGVGARLREFGVAADRIEEFDWWEERKHGEITITAAPAQHFSGRTLWDRNKTLWASWSIRSGNERIFYSGDTGYFPGFKDIGQRLGPFDVALMENGAYDSYWPTVHMTPEETVQGFQDVGARMLYLVHNSTFDLAFHTWQEPLQRVAALAEQKGIVLATPEIGEALTLGKPRANKKWWEGMK
ncbi:MBL fold metallo-hydrolase [Ramlibacter sp.]|uniref:MBL fold metallo-hydrolase n=1 Tax=Ramlibacter sp. TaxID=1917967 RepID=UPI003D0DA6C1